MTPCAVKDCDGSAPATNRPDARESTRGYWYQAGSFARREYPRGVVRHADGQPANWREDRDRLQRFALARFPDATGFRYSGGVLRFRWNNGEGSGQVHESGTTPGPLGESQAKR